MELLVRASDRDLAELAEALAAADALRGRVRPVRASPRPGEMGGAIHALAVLLVPGGAATALVTGLAFWLQHRRSGKRPGAEVTLEFPDGTRLSITNTPTDELQAAVAEAIAAWTVRD